MGGGNFLENALVLVRINPCSSVKRTVIKIIFPLGFYWRRKIAKVSFSDSVNIILNEFQLHPPQLRATTGCCTSESHFLPEIGFAV